MNRATVTVSKSSAEATLRPVMSAAELADYLGVSEVTLNTWRANGNGPRFMKIGRRCKYRASDVLDWMERRSGSSTTQLAGVADRYGNPMAVSD